MNTSSREFLVRFTGDFHRADGTPLYQSFGTGVLDAEAGIRRESFAEHRLQIDPDQIGPAQAVVGLSPKVTAGSISRADDLLAICRFGVGYDSVDVPACTAADVALITAVGAVDRSVAEATVGWMLALTHHFRTKDNLVRAGEWDARSRFMGIELRQRTLGLIV